MKKTERAKIIKEIEIGVSILLVMYLLIGIVLGMAIEDMRIAKKLGTERYTKETRGTCAGKCVVDLSEVGISGYVWSYTEEEKCFCVVETNRGEFKYMGI